MNIQQWQKLQHELAELRARLERLETKPEPRVGRPPNPPKEPRAD